MPSKQDSAAASADPETIALQALAFLAETEGLLEVFVNSAGLGVNDLAQRADDPDFLGAVLDFLMQDDRWVLGFAAQAGLSPDTVVWARARLPGGALPHWT